MFRDIKRDAFHRSHPLVPAMNASTTPVSPAAPPAIVLRKAEGEGGGPGLLDHPRMVIRQIYSLATIHERGIYYHPRRFVQRIHTIGI